MIYFNYTDTKKAVVSLNAAPLFNKKSGTALLLFRYLRLWYCLYIRTSNTEAHADMYNHAHTYLRCARIWIYIPRGHQMSHCLEYYYRIFQVPISQEQSAIDAFIMSCNCPP